MRGGERKRWLCFPLVYAFIVWFPVCALAGDQTHNLGASELPSQGDVLQFCISCPYDALYSKGKFKATYCMQSSCLSPSPPPSKFCSTNSQFEFFSFFFLRFYSFIFRVRGREGERGKETWMCGCLSCSPHWGPGGQPRPVP